MQKWIIPAVVVACLAGCVTFVSPIPENYNGPLATIKDSFKFHSARKSDFFYLAQVNDRPIEDSLLKTRMLNRGGGTIMVPVALERKVPAETATFKVVGRTEYAAPILSIGNAVYEVAGEVQFSPEKDRTYIVRGQLGESYSAVWIEDAATNAIVVEKIEIKGSDASGTSQR